MEKENRSVFPTNPLLKTEDKGISLRTWFAGQALIGYLSAGCYKDYLAEEIARYCYSISNAMLYEDEKWG